MGALRPGCAVGGHKVLIWPQESNIDRKIDTCRFQKYKICTEVVGVINCRHGQFPVKWNVSHTHTLSYIFSGFYMILTIESCVRSWDWLTALALWNSCLWFEKHNFHMKLDPENFRKTSNPVLNSFEYIHCSHDLIKTTHHEIWDCFSENSVISKVVDRQILNTNQNVHLVKIYGGAICIRTSRDYS